MLAPITADGMAINVAALRINYEKLSAFKKQVDDSLKTLDESPASNGQVSEQTLARPAYGDGFAEANELAVAYEKAHDNLKDLSKQLSEQLEALSLAIDCSQKGADETDQKSADRLRKLQRDSQTSWDRHHTKHGPKDHAHAGHQTHVQA